MPKRRVLEPEQNFMTDDEIAEILEYLPRFRVLPGSYDSLPAWDAVPLPNDPAQSS